MYGDDKRLRVHHYILQITPPVADIANIDRRIFAGKETLEYIQTGRESEPGPASGFPAHRLQTGLEWEDLVIKERTRDHLIELLLWFEHKDELAHNWGLEKIVAPGYRCLFYGPPGTGKSLTAALLGKRTGRPVYRIDLSQLVSKYIGETGKNLEKIFTRAADKDWILFFDEAESLFGNRTQVKTSNDRYANQETAYLLQRIETCSNPVIMATNMKSSIDSAFIRRFQSIVDFPMPGKKERLKLWEQNLHSGKIDGFRKNCERNGSGGWRHR